MSADARRDMDAILDWTLNRFGTEQARRYAAMVERALRALEGGPATLGVRPREDIGPGVLTLHIARGGRKGRHVVLFRVAAETRTLDVLRLLHDSMDLPRHPPPSPGGPDAA
nr:type II toxin-antitoxin system RelE/ParE family toxin [Roseospira navarrensis]